MALVYIYVVDRDFGFAPNPFHGCCSLATCKPGIRRSAKVGDWVIGMGGARLKAKGRCIFAMRVTEARSFNEYWSDPTYLDKRPVRNGSRRMMVGDNIYHLDADSNAWSQADSHHSNADGTANLHNLANDTSANRVLLSRHFFYFGKAAQPVPEGILVAMGYENGRNYRVFGVTQATSLLDWLAESYGRSINLVGADPFDFDTSEMRYSGADNRLR